MKIQKAFSKFKYNLSQFKYPNEPLSLKIKMENISPLYLFQNSF